MSVKVINKRGRIVWVPDEFYKDHAKKQGFTKIEETNDEVQTAEVDSGQVESTEAQHEEIMAEEKAEVLEEGHVCDVCGKVCKSALGLNSHKKTHEK